MNIKQMKERKKFLEKQEKQILNSLVVCIEENQKFIYDKLVISPFKFPKTFDLRKYVIFRCQSIVQQSDIKFKALIDQINFFSKNHFDVEEARNLLKIKFVFLNFFNEPSEKSCIVRANINTGVVEFIDKKITFEFEMKSFKRLESCFQEPFSISINHYTLNLFTMNALCNLVLDKIKQLEQFSLPKLLSLSSYEYFSKYGYSVILKDYVPVEMASVVVDYVLSLKNNRICPTINYLFIIAPIFKEYFRIEKFANHPYYYFIEWKRAEL